eukprot:783680-Rhodomonas_salina.1
MDALHVMWSAQARYDQSELGGWGRRSKRDCLSDFVRAVSDLFPRVSALLGLLGHANSNPKHMLNAAGLSFATRTKAVKIGYGLEAYILACRMRG